MKNSILIILCCATFTSFSQTAADIFTASDYQYTYLGIDYSHAKFNGNFSQFAEAGSTGVVAIKAKYFTGWNYVVYNEREKYSFQNALRKENISYDLDDIGLINDNTVVEDMEGAAATFTQEDIQGFINNSEYTVTEGVGIMFIAEYIDKNKVEACFHFVLVNMETKEILIHERMVNQPGGFGLRNYWIKPIYASVATIKKSLFKRWKKEYAVKK